MLIFLTILNIISLIKNILDLFISLLEINIICMKLIIIIFMPILTYFIYIYIKRKRLKLSYLRKLKYSSYLKYKINDDNDLDITISFLYIYFLIFICLIIINRINNVNKDLNLHYFFNKIDFFYQNMSFFNFMINITLLIYLIIIYIFFFNKLLKVVKQNIIKIYLYNILSFSFHMKILSIQDFILADNILSKFTSYLAFHEGSIYIHFIKRFLFVHIEGLKFIIHRLILLIVIFYDIFFNDLILSTMFKILPYVFIYELWVRFSIFMLGINTTYDQVVSLIFYGENYELDYDIEYVYLDNKPYSKIYIKEILMNYVKIGFINKEYMPENPMSQGAKIIIKFWKQHTFDIIKNKIKNNDKK